MREESQITQDVNDSWLRLGVYELMPEGEANARVIVMLAVHRGGTIIGQFYEVGTEQQSAVRGTINKQTRQVNWADAHGTVTVRTDLDSFAQEEATATVRFHNAVEAIWTMRFISAPLQILSNARTKPNNEQPPRCAWSTGYRSGPTKAAEAEPSETSLAAGRAPMRADRSSTGRVRPRPL